ncbi:MAG: TRZ/ATZ family hydrolase [Proteobacteria bacterium]|nr:TRZ/ATZ family hydrolase [Pseudomonadota bacterium]
METQPQHCDLLIEAGWVIPVEPHGVVLAEHAVAVKDGAILAVLPWADARAAYRAAETVSRPHAALIPGLVNAHAHNAMTLLRGVADDKPLMEWLSGHIWPIEGAVVSPAFVADGVELAIAEMLRGGTTCCNDMYFFPDAAAATYRRHGFRALVGLIVIDFPTAWASTPDEYFDKAGEVHDLWRADPLVRTCFAPHAPYTVGDAGFERVRMLADQLDVPVHCHLHETAHEIAESIKVHGERPIARLDRLGVFNDRLIAVHMTQLNDAEIALCAARGVSVAHCPESNLKLASGACRAEDLRHAGVTLALGSDGCASNNDLDLFGEMRSAALLAKHVAGNAAAMPAADVLRAATLGGARALGMGDLIGSIEPGKRADLVLVDFDRIETQPLYDPISHLVYSSGRQQVADVWIDGQRKLRDGVLVDIDTHAIIANARQWRARVAAIGRTSP